MSRAGKRRALGALVVAVLVAAVALQWRADEADARAHTLTALDADAVEHIDVSLKGLPDQHFDRRGGHWTSTGPTDEGRVAELALLAATPVAEWRAVGEFDLARIGLSPPLATLVLDGTRVDFGEMTALGRQRYARVGDRIAFVPAQALPRAPRTQALPTTTDAPAAARSR